MRCTVFIHSRDRRPRGRHRPRRRRSRRDRRKPNVIFILCDDLGYGDIGPYGQKKIKTPNIDRFAAEGMRFTQHYAGSTVCAPSRSCLLDRQAHGARRRARQSRVGGQGLQGRHRPARRQLSRSRRMFKQAGYDTAIIGKWGMGAIEHDRLAVEAGVRLTSSATPATATRTSTTRRTCWRNDEKVVLDGKQYSHDLIGAEALKWLRKIVGTKRARRRQAVHALSHVHDPAREDAGAGPRPVREGELAREREDLRRDDHAHGRERRQGAGRCSRS